MDIRNYKGTGGEYARSYGRPVLHHRDHFFLEIAERCTSKALVLDAGCGTADLPIIMAQRNTNLSFVCTDMEKVNLENAKKIVEELGLAKRFEFIHCKADELSIEDASVDIGMACGVFSYCENIHNSVRQFFNKVKPGGFSKFDFSTRPPGDWLIPLTGLPWVPYYNPILPECQEFIESLGTVSKKIEDKGLVLYELKQIKG